MKYNNEFSNIDTSAKAYFLGLLYSDGCISNDGVSLQLSGEDYKILEILQQLFPFFYLRRYEPRNKQKLYATCLVKNSKVLYNDLYNIGLRPRKSYENKENINIPEMSKDLYSHFIRGYFDGDGSIYVHNNRPNGAFIEICSVSYKFIKWLESYLNSIQIETKIRLRYPSKHRNQILYVIYSNKSESNLKFKDFLYKDCLNLFIERKYKRFQNLKLVKDSRIKNIFDLKRDFICPYCNSNHIILASVRIMKYGKVRRLKCKSCNKQHTVLYDATIAQYGRKPILEGV